MVYRDHSESTHALSVKAYGYGGDAVTIRAAEEEWDQAIARLSARLERAEEALRAGSNYLAKLSDPMCPPAIRQVALDHFAESLAAAGEENER